MPTTVADVLAALDRLAPAGSAMEWDNPGLQVGDRAQPVTRALVALDCTAEVVGEAEAVGAELVVAHHPLIFSKLARVAAGPGAAGLAYRLARKGIALAAAHTNLDRARGGVSFALAELLGLRDVSFLHPTENARRILTTFVPALHVDAVRDALAQAGAGQIGAYSACSFGTPGTGTFRPGEGAAPFTGTPPGQLERAGEIRLEMEVPAWHVEAAVRALRAAHPYEEPAYHVVASLHPDTGTGLGAIGLLPAPLGRDEFLARVCRALGTPAVRATRGPGQVQRVAVCGGSGSDFARDALAAGAHAFVTADVTYHKFFDVLGADGAPQMLYVDAGHYETERHAEALLQDGLARLLPGVDWRRTALRTLAADVFVAPRR